MQISRIRLSDKTSRGLSHATPSAASEHHLELIGFPISMSFATFCVCLELRSLPFHQSYPVSAVLRTSPPPQSARPVPHGRPVGPVIPDLTTLGASRVACAFLVYVLPPLPRAAAGSRRRFSTAQPYQPHPSPITLSGRPAHRPFRGFAQRSLALRPAHSRRHLYVTCYTEGFSHFVTSMTAPVASGWSGCRVGLAPTGKRRLGTAHTCCGRSGPRPPTPSGPKVRLQESPQEIRSRHAVPSRSSPK